MNKSILFPLIILGIANVSLLKAMSQEDSKSHLTLFGFVMISRPNPLPAGVVVPDYDNGYCGWIDKNGERLAKVHASLSFPKGTKKCIEKYLSEEHEVIRRSALVSKGFIQKMYPGCGWYCVYAEDGQGYFIRKDNREAVPMAKVITREYIPVYVHPLFYYSFADDDGPLVDAGDSLDE